MFVFEVSSIFYELAGKVIIVLPAETKTYTVKVETDRLDKFLASQDLDITRSQIHRLIEDLQVVVNGSYAKPSQKLRFGDTVFVTIPPPKPLELVPQGIPVPVIYEDDDVIVVDKPAGLSVHPGPGHPDGTLVNALLALCPDIIGVGGVIRPGIVHRLDKDTSGIMVVAKTDKAHLGLSRQLKDREVTKGYLAMARGPIIPPEGIIDQPIGRDPRNRKKMAVLEEGRASRTNYKVIERLSSYEILQVYLDSGRTHQIRVHMAYLGHPLVGDRLYGKDNSVLNRQFLHANHLGFTHPLTSEHMDFRSNLPDELQTVVDSCTGP